MSKIQYEPRYLMNLAPYRQEVGYVTKRGYFVNAAKWEGDFKQGAAFMPTVLMIEQDNRGIELENDMGGANWFPLDPAEIIKGLCGEDGMKRVASGVMQVSGPEPSFEEIDRCLKAYEAAGRQMIEDADKTYSSHHKIAEISTAAKRWATYFGLTREWAPQVDAREFKACINCGETVLAVARICKHCGQSPDVPFEPIPVAAAEPPKRRGRPPMARV